MPGLADILQGLASIFGTQVPGVPNQAGQASPSTVSYAPAIETALGGLAGALQPQAAGPYGRRTWGAALSNSILGGLGGYNAGENQVAQQQSAAQEAVMNQQKLAGGALNLKSNQKLFSQYGSTNPEVVKLKAIAGQKRIEANSFAVGANAFANDPTTPPDLQAFYKRAAGIASSTGDLDAVTKLTSIDKDAMTAAIDRGKLSMIPLEQQKLQAGIAHEQAGTTHEQAETGHVGLENVNTEASIAKARRELAQPIPEGKEAGFKSMGADGKLHQHVLNPRTGLYEDKGVAEANKAGVGDKPATRANLISQINQAKRKGFTVSRIDPDDNVYFEADPSKIPLVGDMITPSPYSRKVPGASLLNNPEGAATGVPDSSTSEVDEIKTGPAPAGATLLRKGLEHSTGKILGEYRLSNGTVEHRYLP